MRSDKNTIALTVTMPVEHVEALINILSRVGNPESKKGQEINTDDVKSLIDLFKKVKTNHEELIENPEQREAPITIPVYVGRRLIL